MFSPIIRRYPLPNGDVIVSLRESTLRAGIKAANAALRLTTPSPRLASHQGGGEAYAAPMDGPEATRRPECP